MQRDPIALSLSVPPYAACLTLLAGVALVGYGWTSLSRGGGKPQAVKRILIGLFVMLVVAPTLLMDRLEVNDGVLSMTRGFWFAPFIDTVDLDNVQSVEIAERSAKLILTQESWIFTRRNGEVFTFEPGDLGHAHSEELADVFRALGIRVTRSR